MDESRTADAQAINQSTASRIPVRSISLTIVVTVVMYVGMATLADWEAFGAAVSALPSLLWLQVVVLSLLSYILRFARWHHFIVARGHKVPILRNLEIYLAAFALTLTPGKAGETIRSVYFNPYGVSYQHSIGTITPETVYQCDADYKVLSAIQLNEFNSFLKHAYQLEQPSQTFRAAVGPHLRVWGKTNLNPEEPLHASPKQNDKDCIDNLIKTYNNFEVIKARDDAARTAEKGLKVIRSAAGLTSAAKKLSG
jgi:hypothetical protein